MLIRSNQGWGRTALLRDVGCGTAALFLLVASACSKAADNAAVDVALMAEDPCAVERLNTSDIAWLKENDTRQAPTGAQSRSNDYDAKLGQCKVRRNQELRVRQCGDTAKVLSTGKAALELSALGDDERQLIQRIGTSQLTADDLKRFDKADFLPCGDTPERAALRDAFLSAAARTGSAWLDATPVPAALLEAVRAKGLEASAAKELTATSEVRARSSLSNAKVAADLASTASACEVVTQVGQATGPACTALVQKFKAMTVAEEATRKREQARCDRLRSAREACEKQCEARQPKDDLGLVDFDKGMDCGERCEQAIPMASCE